MRRLPGEVDFSVADKDLDIPATEILIQSHIGEITGGMLTLIGRVNEPTWGLETKDNYLDALEGADEPAIAHMSQGLL